MLTEWKWKTLLIALVAFITTSVNAQPPMGRMGGGNSGNMKIGHFYGKVIDGEGKGVSYATVSLYGMRFDTITKSRVEYLVDGQITDEKGEFSLEELPVVGEFTLKISFLGYSELEKKVSFGIIPGKDMDRSKMGEMMRNANFDVDLGNISLLEEAEVLDEVVVSGTKTNVVIALDKKIYRVDQDVSSQGGTAQDALRNVPSLSIDLDGNVSLRNGSPQILIDGRPTTLTLEQIPSDDIESVEVITNPSAKFDASGGQAGIVNIVMKKNKKLGYNGMVMTGMDSQLGGNLGGNINVREGDVNIFANGFANARRGESFRTNERTSLLSTPNSLTLQESVGQSVGTFGRGRLGMDWFMDNRNTITFEGSYMRGQFGGPNTLDVSFDPTGTGNSYAPLYTRVSDGFRLFQNVGGSVLYKHLYVKKGKELTADLNYNQVSFDSDNTFETNFENGSYGLQQQQGGGGTGIVTVQVDYVDPLTENIKLETGVRASMRDVQNNNYNYFLNPSTNTLEQIITPADEYVFTDDVYAAYATISQQIGTWSYQLGLRGESSFYTGSISDGQKFTNNFPISLFPSLFITKQLNEEDNLQFSVSRRVQRPNFFQLIPFTDYSDSLNLRRGNPNLIPEFTSSVELSYQNILNDKHNILATIYYKRATNLITSFQVVEFDENVGRTSIINTYQNSNNSQAYGVEFTVRNQIGKNIDFNTNLNLYNSRVDASNVQEGLINDQFSWFLKENININLPKSFRLQLSGQYQSKTAYSLAQSGRWHGGGGGNSAQGYSIPIWYADIGISKSILKRKGTISINMQDIFATRINGNYSETSAFIDQSMRHRNFRVVRANFSYRFGKMDSSLFRRKNMNSNEAGSDMMGG